MNNQIVKLIAFVFIGVAIAYAFVTFNNKDSVTVVNTDASPAAEAPVDVTAADAAMNEAGADIGATGDQALVTTGTSTVNGFFALTNQDGEAVSSSSWGPVYKVVFFGFTNCPDICPTTLQKIAGVMNGLGDMEARVQPVFITVDPARDTPDVMKGYVANFHPKLAGLTGTQEQIDAVVSNYKAYATKMQADEGATDYNVDHSAFVYLINPDDTLATAISGSSSVDEMIEKFTPFINVESQTTAQPAVGIGSNEIIEQTIAEGAPATDPMTADTGMDTMTTDMPEQQMPVDSALTPETSGADAPGAAAPTGQNPVTEPTPAAPATADPHAHHMSPATNAPTTDMPSAH